jgi:hypothetical protein
MAPNNMALMSFIGKASRVLAPLKAERRFASLRSHQLSWGSLNEVQAKSEGGVFFTLSIDSDIVSRTDSDRVTSSPPSPLPANWKSAAGQAFLPNSPSVASDPYSDDDEPIQEKVDRIMARAHRSRDLPSTCYYSSNHVMINRERTKRTITPLVRMRELDEIAREHVEAMAKENRKFHSDPSSLKMKLSPPERRMGENVAKGDTIREIHREMMTISSDTNNILDSRYSQFGMATAKASDGELYICQIFRG